MKPALRPFHDEAKAVADSLVGRPFVVAQSVARADVETIRKALEAAYRAGVQDRKH